MAELSGKIIYVKPLAGLAGWYLYNGYKFHESWLEFDIKNGVLATIKQLRAGEFKVTPEHIDYVSGEMETLSGKKLMAYPHEDFPSWYVIHDCNFHESWLEFEDKEITSDGSLPENSSGQAEKSHQGNDTVREELTIDIDTLSDIIKIIKRLKI
jgi:hypothetical protein